MTSSMKLTSLIAAILLILPFNTFGQQTEIAIGDKIADAQGKLHKLDATDITAEIELDRKNAPPPEKLYWNVVTFKCVIALSVKDGKIATVSYWTKKDFSRSKIDRIRSRLYAQSIIFDKTTNRLSVNQLPGYDLYCWPTDSKNWNFSLLDNSVNRNRTVEEIQDRKNKVSGLDNLKSRLSKLPAKTDILLLSVPNQSYSKNSYFPQTILNELRQFAAGKDLTLQIIKND
jgi:hypothetical protein